MNSELDEVQKTFKESKEEYESQLDSVHAAVPMIFENAFGIYLSQCLTVFGFGLSVSVAKIKNSWEF